MSNREWLTSRSISIWSGLHVIGIVRDMRSLGAFPGRDNFSGFPHLVATVTLATFRLDSFMT